MPAWSGLFDGVNSTAYTLQNNTNDSEFRLRYAGARVGFNKLEGLFNALIGAASGGTATMTRKRRVGQTGTLGDLAASLGGLAAVETVTDISRTTTAADVTNLKALTVGTKFQPTYPGDRSGNGK